MNNGSRRGSSSSPAAARAGHRRRRRGARRAGARPGARRASSPRTSCRAAASASASARTASASAPLDVDGIDDERQLGERRPLPRPRGALDPDRPGGARLPRRRRDRRRGGRRLAPRPARRRVPRADRPLRRGVPRCEASSWSGIDLEAFALLRAVAPRRSGLQTDAAGRRRRGLARPRPLDARDLRRRRSATSRACSSGAASKLESAIALRPRPHARRGTRAQARRLARGRPRSGRGLPAAPRCASRSGASCRRSRASSSPRSSSTRASRDRSRSREILVTGGTSRLPGLPEELERLTRVRVRRADPLAHVQASDSVRSRDDLASLAIAIGLGVEV